MSLELSSAAEADIGERVGIKFDNGVVYWGTIKVVEHFIEFDDGDEQFFDLRHFTKEGRVFWNEEEKDKDNHDNNNNNNNNTNKTTIAQKRKPDEDDRGGKGNTSYTESRKKTRKSKNNKVENQRSIKKKEDEASMDAISNPPVSSAATKEEVLVEEVVVVEEVVTTTSQTLEHGSENGSKSDGASKLTTQKVQPMNQKEDDNDDDDDDDEQTEDDIEVIPVAEIVEEVAEIVEEVVTTKTEVKTETMISNGNHSTLNPQQLSSTTAKEEHITEKEEREETNGTNTFAHSNGDDTKSISQIISSTTTTTTKEEVVEEQEMEETTGEASQVATQATEVISETNNYTSLIHQELEKDGMDLKIKQEGETNTVSTLTIEERAKAKARLEQWIQANTAPDGKPRRVFRRGCSAEGSITTILGGSGMEPWPMVSMVPGTNKDRPDTEQWTGSPNKFIQPGQYYVAGNDAWNPFGPQFPGDTGLVNIHAIQVNEEQAEFHFFIECSSKKNLRHWHGKEAIGGRLYVGVYRQVEDALEMGVFFKDLEYHHRRAIADHMRWGGGDYFAMMRSKVNDLHRDAAMDIFEDDWPSFSPEQKETHAIIVMLEVTDYQFDFVPVEQVRYDEELYAALVACGATKKGTACVSLDPTELGFPNLLEP